MLGGLSIVMKKPPRRQHVKSVCALRGGFFQNYVKDCPVPEVSPPVPRVSYVCLRTD